MLEQRRDAGLAGEMQFTYRNPARSCNPGRTLPGARSLVVGAWRYLRSDGPASAAGTPPTSAAPAPAPPRPVPPPHPGGPRPAPPRQAPPPRPGAPGPEPPAPASLTTVARYAREDFYAELRTALGAVAAVLRATGWRAVVLADDNALVDRAAAVRAGLGWYGKNTNVLLPGQGSWYVLGAVLTDAPLPPAAPAEDGPGGCGTCTRCLPACPTGALVAEGVLDARRCLAWLLQAAGSFPREWRVAAGDRLYGCDDCQDVCPVNRRGARVAPPPVPGPGATATVDALGLLAASDGELLARFGRWYLAGRDPGILRRNALIALGNAGDPADPRVLRAVGAALAGEDPTLRQHAVWAAARLGRAELVAGLADDPDPTVRAEVAAAGTVPARGASGGGEEGMAPGGVPDGPTRRT